MIKINLLRERTLEPTVARVPVEPKPIQAPLILAVVFIAAIALGTWYWYATYTELEEKTQRRDTMQREAKRLEEIQKEVERYQRINEVLKERTDIIEQLKRDQTGPVRMMNAFVDSLPAENPQVWFESLSQTRDDVYEDIALVGYAYDVNSIADFFTSLKNKAYFTQIDWVYYDKSKIPIKFEFKCRRELKKSTKEGEQNG